MTPATPRTALISVAVCATAAGLALGLSSPARRLGGEDPSARVGAVSPADYGPAAAYLRIGVPALRADLERGETLGEITTTVPGRTVAGLTQALARAKAARLRAAVAAGRLSPSAASAGLATVVARARAEVARVPIVGVAAALAAAGRYLHAGRSTLLAEARAGRSLAEMADRRGATASGLVAALLRDRRAHIARRLAAGELTGYEAAVMQRGLPARMTALVHRGAAHTP